MEQFLMFESRFSDRSNYSSLTADMEKGIHVRKCILNLTSVYYNESGKYSCEQRWPANSPLFSENIALDILGT